MAFRSSSLVDALMLGTLTAFPTLIIPFVILLSGSGAILALMLFLFSFSLGVFQSVVSLIISHRLGHSFTRRDRFRLSYFVPLEIVSYRFLGVIFNTFGTIAYFINKNSWNKVQRVGKQHQTYGEELTGSENVIPILQKSKKTS